jgi:Cytochrome c554 and c-prime
VSDARLLLALAGLLGCSRASGEPAQPELARTELDRSPEACAVCHEEIAAQWRGSMHARAWDDPVFRRELEARPAPSCRGCHAPASSAPGRTTGVDCASCHVRDGEILASTVSSAGTRAHPMRLEPRLRTAESCAECHQFQFTDDGVHDPAEALQNTVVEHRDSESFARGEHCQACHMPELRGHASHGFPGIHDPEQLAGAVDVELTARHRGASIEIEVRVRGADIGHAFPTGDVFRSAVLRVYTDQDASEIVMQRWLASTVDADGTDLHVRTVDDTRVPAPGRGELREIVELHDAGATEIGWELLLHRVPPARAAVVGLTPEQATRRVQSGITPVLGPTTGATPTKP